MRFENTNNVNFADVSVEASRGQVLIHVGRGRLYRLYRDEAESLADMLDKALADVAAAN